MILYVNTCVRAGSRTQRLARLLLSALGGEAEEIRPAEIAFPTVDEAFLRRRDEAVAAGDRSAPIFDLARQFAQADTIVIAAPFWDLSFPASLKRYLEQVTVPGLTFAYAENGAPYGMCRAKKLFYVTTAGGQIRSEEYGCGYVKALAQSFFGIRETVLFKAEGLDVAGADVEAILQKTEREIQLYVEENP